jgi:hypothetical protein
LPSPISQHLADLTGEETISSAARSPQRAQRVILVRDRHPEDRNHRITDELLHRSTVPLDDPAHPLEIAREHDPHRLRIGALAERGRPDDVAEHRGHRLALLT